ncbi:hypothetical protein EDD11_007689 [Mortierella claussenii]|nr:hypothetical protein EDD11_007689 [Mortierella claussenii]
MPDILRKVRTAIEVDHVPIVISDWHLCAAWDKDLFSNDGISKHFNLRTKNDSRMITVRDQDKMVDKVVRLKEFIGLLSQEKCPYCWKDEDQIPKAWDSFLTKLLPEEFTFCGPYDLNARFKDNRKVSSSNLMGYIGGHGTWTPCHFDHCGSTGHNIMLWADKDSSSEWYIASPKDYGRVKELWASLEQFFEQEKYYATPEQLRTSGITFYKVDQKPGDLIILPPMAPHQVYNKGRATVKLAWNRITPETALNAIQNVLPRYKERQSSDIVLSSATIAYGRYYSYREREKDTDREKMKWCSECETTRSNWMSLHCLNQRQAQHKTVNSSSIGRYNYQRKPCKSTYCERCIFKFSNTTWFEAIKWSKDFRCKCCAQDQEQQQQNSFPKNRWYADPRGYNNLNRGAVDDPSSQEGKSQDDFYGFRRHFPHRSKDTDVDRQSVKDKEIGNNETNSTSPLQKLVTVKGDAKLATLTPPVDDLIKRSLRVIRSDARKRRAIE